MAIYLTIEGVTGPVTAAGHEKWIEILSFQWGVGRGISMSIGDVSQRESSLPSISEVSIAHNFDDSSITLFDLSVSGATGKKAQIDFTRTAVGQAAAVVYLHYELENTLISGYSIAGTGDSAPHESLSLNFNKITEKYTPFNKDNTPGTPVIKGFDLVTGKPF